MLNRLSSENAVNGRELEIPSSRMQSNASALAKLGALIANKGEIDGFRLLSPETVQLFLSNPVKAHDQLVDSTTCFTAGGVGKFMSEIVLV